MPLVLLAMLLNARSVFAIFKACMGEPGVYVSLFDPPPTMAETATDGPA